MKISALNLLPQTLVKNATGEIGRVVEFYKKEDHKKSWETLLLNAKLL
jgi:hypothetical protein